MGPLVWYLTLVERDPRYGPFLCIVSEMVIEQGTQIEGTYLEP